MLEQMHVLYCSLWSEIKRLCYCCKYSTCLRDYQYLQDLVNIHVYTWMILIDITQGATDST